MGQRKRIEEKDVQDMILFYEAKGRWSIFSNFSYIKVFWKGRFWRTAEHAYHSEKFLRSHIKDEIFRAKTPEEAKKIAQKYKLLVRPDWRGVRRKIMEQIVSAKLKQHSYIQKRLLETGSKEIVEDSPRDDFWGRGPNWDGQNNMGKIWMKFRRQLRGKKK